MTRPTFSSESDTGLNLKLQATGLLSISSFTFYTGADPTQYVPSSTPTVRDLIPSQWNCQVCFNPLSLRWLPVT
jgi:hypothetical protein